MVALSLAVPALGALAQRAVIGVTSDEAAQAAACLLGRSNFP